MLDCVAEGSHVGIVQIGVEPIILSELKVLRRNNQNTQDLLDAATQDFEATNTRIGAAIETGLEVINLYR